MYDPSTKTERQWKLPVEFKSIGGFLYGIDVAPDGTVWFSQPWGNTIGRYDPATDTIKQWEIPRRALGRAVCGRFEGQRLASLCERTSWGVRAEDGAVPLLGHSRSEETVTC